MTESLRALLTGAIDYAGLFPPASLSLEETVRNFAAYRKWPESWMLGRLVCPAVRLTELAALDAAIDGEYSVTVLGRASKTLDEFDQQFDDCLASIRGGPKRARIEGLEFVMPQELTDPDVEWMRDLYMDQPLQSINGMRSTVPQLKDAVAFLEAPQRPDPPRPTNWFHELLHLGHTSNYVKRLQRNSWIDGIGTIAAGVAEMERSPRDTSRQIGAKLRTGGTEASAFPTSEQLGLAICICRYYDVFWKATAGLHHPLRHFDAALGTHMHGFINVLTAAVMADVFQLHADRVQAILDDEEPSHFQFTDDALSWRDLEVPTHKIAAARQRSMRSFGSCSFEEPVQDLKTLGWL
jgi:hypothetical protein